MRHYRDFFIFPLSYYRREGAAGYHFVRAALFAGIITLRELLLLRLEKVPA
jgi:hypothetical protein